MLADRFWTKLLALFARPASAGLAFTPRARQLVALARREATQRQCGRIEVIHLWMALPRLGTSRAGQILRQLGVDPAALRTELEPFASPGSTPVSATALQYCMDVKKSLAIAAREAKALGFRYVGSEHLLLGMLRFSEHPAVEVLGRHSLDIDRARAAIGTGSAGDSGS